MEQLNLIKIQVADLKGMIAAEKEIEPSTQKLIYKGNQTEDDRTLESYSYKEGEFFVLMVLKV